MDLRIDKQKLINAVGIVSKAVPSKTTMPILECILIDASGEDIHLIANDMELGIQTTVDGTINEHGIIAVKADIFSDIVRKLPDAEVLIHTEGEKIIIRCGKSMFHIMGKDGQDFVYLPDVDKQYGIEISEFTLRDIINKTLFSISVNDTNRIMTGEMFEIRDHMLRVVALDGHRIAARMVELRQPYDNRKVIIPGKSLSEISKILGGDMEKAVHVYFTDKHALFELEKTIVVSRLIEGEYFKIDQMLSMNYSTHFRIHREEFAACLDRASLLVREQDKKPIVLLIRDGVVELKMRTSTGSLDEEIDIEKDGSDLDIGFNPKFLLDALRAIDEEEIDVYLQSPRSPAFIRDDHSYCYLILPVNFISV